MADKLSLEADPRFADSPQDLQFADSPEEAQLARNHSEPTPGTGETSLNVRTVSTSYGRRGSALSITCNTKHGPERDENGVLGRDNGERKGASLSHGKYETSEKLSTLSKDMPSHIFMPISEAAVWTHYVKHAREFDEKMLKRFNETLDVFLLFAALFSAVVTTFLVAAYPALQTNSNQGVSSPVSVSTILVNAIWFISLGISLFTAVLAMLVKEWLRAYAEGYPQDPCRHARLRQFRYDGMLRWQVPNIVKSLPILIQIAVFLFFGGLVALLLPLSPLIAALLTLMLVLAVLGYAIMLVMSYNNPECPFKSPLSAPFHFLVRRFWRLCLGMLFWTSSCWRTYGCGVIYLNQNVRWQCSELRTLDWRLILRLGQKARWLLNELKMLDWRLVRRLGQKALHGLYHSALRLIIAPFFVMVGYFGAVVIAVPLVFTYFVRVSIKRTWLSVRVVFPNINSWAITDVVSEDEAVSLSSMIDAAAFGWLLGASSDRDARAAVLLAIVGYNFPEPIWEAIKDIVQRSARSAVREYVIDFRRDSSTAVEDRLATVTAFATLLGRHAHKDLLAPFASWETMELTPAVSLYCYAWALYTHPNPSFDIQRLFTQGVELPLFGCCAVIEYLRRQLALDRLNRHRADVENVLRFIKHHLASSIDLPPPFLWCAFSFLTTFSRSENRFYNRTHGDEVKVLGSGLGWFNDPTQPILLYLQEEFVAEEALMYITHNPRSFELVSASLFRSLISKAVHQQASATALKALLLNNSFWPAQEFDPLSALEYMLALHVKGEAEDVEFERILRRLCNPLFMLNSEQAEVIMRDGVWTTLISQIRYPSDGALCLPTIAILQSVPEQSRTATAVVSSDWLHMMLRAGLPYLLERDERWYLTMARYLIDDMTSGDYLCTGAPTRAVFIAEVENYYQQRGQTATSWDRLGSLPPLRWTRWTRLIRGDK